MKPYFHRLKKWTLLALAFGLLLPFQNCGKFEVNDAPVGETSSSSVGGLNIPPGTDPQAALEMKRQACRALVGKPSIALTSAAVVAVNSGMGGSSGDSRGQLNFNVTKGISNLAAAQSYGCIANTQINGNIVVDASHPADISQAVAMDGSVLSTNGLNDQDKMNLARRALDNFNNMNDGDNSRNSFSTGTEVRNQRQGNNDPLRCVQGSVWVRFISRTNMEGTDFDSSPVYVQVNFTNSCWIENKLAVSPILSRGAGYGTAVAIDGSWAVSVAPKEHASATVLNTGAAHVFRFDGSRWVFSQKLIISDAVSDDTLTAVALKGDTLVLTSKYRGNQGAAFVFRRNASNVWSLSQTLVPSLGQANQEYGHALAFNGTTLAVSAPNYSASGAANDDKSGVVYIYSLNAGSFALTGTLTLSNSSNKAFGSALALDGNTLAVGAPQAVTKEFMGAGEVHLYSLSSLGSPLRSIPSPFPAGGRFGAAVALSGTRLAVGAPSAVGEGNANAGALLYFSNFNNAATVNWANNVGDELLGQSLVFASDGLLVGRPYMGIDGVARGGAVDFLRFTQLDGGGKNIQYRLLGYKVTPSDAFGWSLAVSGTQVIVGARLKSDPNNASGASFIYTKR